MRVRLVYNVVFIFAAAACSDEPSPNAVYGSCADSACGDPFGPALSIAGMVAKHPPVDGTFGAPDVPAVIAALAAGLPGENNETTGIRQVQDSRLYLAYDESPNCSHVHVGRTGEGEGFRTVCACTGGGYHTTEFIKTGQPSDLPIVIRQQFDHCNIGTTLNGVFGFVSLPQPGGFWGEYGDITITKNFQVPSPVRWDFLSSPSAYTADALFDLTGLSTARWYSVNGGSGTILVERNTFDSSKNTGFFSVHAQSGDWTCGFLNAIGKCTQGSSANSPSFPVTLQPPATPAPPASVGTTMNDGGVPDGSPP